MLAGGFALALTGIVEARRWRVIAGLAVFGLAALAKDPLAALGPPLAIGLALALGGRVRPLDRWLPWPGVVLGLALAFGWWALAEYETPGFTWYTVVDNHLLNVARARHFPDEDIPLGAVEFLAVAVLGVVPWIVPAVASVVRLVRRRAWRQPEELPWLALTVWAMGVLGLTALSPFRLPHYGLPAYPAIALLAARGWHEASGRSLAAVHALLFGALAVAAGAGLDDGRLGVHDRRARRHGRGHAQDERARRTAAPAAVVGLPAAGGRRRADARRRCDRPRGIGGDGCPHGGDVRHGGHADAAAAERGQRARPGRQLIAP